MKYLLIVSLILCSCIAKKPKKPRYSKKLKSHCLNLLDSTFLADDPSFLALTTPFQSSLLPQHDYVLVSPASYLSTPSFLHPYIFSDTLSFYVTKSSEKSLSLASRDTSKKTQNTQSDQKTKQIFQNHDKSLSDYIRSSTSYDIHKKIKDSELNIEKNQKELSEILPLDALKKIDSEEYGAIKMIADLEVKIQDTLALNLKKILLIKHLNPDKSPEYQKDFERGEKDVLSWISQMKNDYKEWRFLKQQSHTAITKQNLNIINSLILKIDKRYHAVKPEDFEHKEKRSLADDLADENIRSLSLQWFQLRKIEFLKSEELTVFQNEFNRRKVGPWQEIGFRTQDHWQRYKIPIMLALSAIAIVQIRQLIISSKSNPLEDKVGSNSDEKSENDENNESEEESKTPPPSSTETPKEKITKLILKPFRPDQDDSSKDGDSKELHIELKDVDSLKIHPLKNLQPDLCK